MQVYSYTASLVNHNEIPIELSCYQGHLALIALIIYLMTMKILGNMAHMRNTIWGNAILQLSWKDQNEIPIDLLC